MVGRICDEKDVDGVTHDHRIVPVAMQDGQCHPWRIAEQNLLVKARNGIDMAMNS
jgi:hypothetical protein